jgi:ribonuclease III
MLDMTDTSDEIAELLEECQEVIGYRFLKPKLLLAALTHTSGANVREDSNERLEFLGDSVLGLVTCELLFHRFPNYQEGEMTKVKSAVVSRTTCAAFSEDMDLGRFLILGRGMKTSEAIPSNLLADVYESLVAAIYLDGGLDAARDFVLRHLSDEINRVASGESQSNHKSLLQQTAQRMFGCTPKYVMLDTQGPEHARSFKVGVIIKEQYYPPAWGKNKRTAEARAAENALAMLQGTEIPYNHE